jgi:hypothetical protein
MGLAAFIRANEEAIIAGWQAFAQTYLPSAENMDRAALRDHIIGLLRFIADDLETPETERQRSEKAKGQGPKGGGAHDGAAETHADLRSAAGFDTVEMISEFRALRASVIKLWRAEWSKVDDVLPDLLRFNEAIDQVMTESLSRFVETFNRSGGQIVKILVHDVQDPLIAVHSAARILLAKDTLSAEDAKIVSQIETSSSRINGFVSDVIDAVSAPLGRDWSSSPASMDVGTPVQDAAKGVKAARPRRNRR